mgnify:CR=1 FL=1
MTDDNKKTPTDDKITELSAWQKRNKEYLEKKALEKAEEAETEETESEESYQINARKLERLAEIVRDKLLEADSIYAVYSEKTGEPYLFSTTYDRGEEGYLLSLIHI